MSVQTINQELLELTSKLARYEQEVYSGKSEDGQVLSYADVDLRAAAIPELRKRKAGTEAILRLLMCSLKSSSLQQRAIKAIDLLFPDSEALDDQRIGGTTFIGDPLPPTVGEARKTAYPQYESDWRYWIDQATELGHEI